MFGRGLFSKRRAASSGGHDNDDEEASEHVLGQHAVTSSFITGIGAEEFSLEGHSLFGQLSPDPVISTGTTKNHHRAPLSHYARSMLRAGTGSLMDNNNNKATATAAGLEEGHFDDMSSMHDDSLYFGAADAMEIAGFSSPIRADYSRQTGTDHNNINLLARSDSPGESTFLNDNDGDIQTVATGDAFSTILSPSIRSELRPDIESSSVVQRGQRTVGALSVQPPTKAGGSPTSDGAATVIETPTNSPREKPTDDPATGFFARLRRGPLWLRVVFIGSFLLFIGAILLAVVGLMVSTGRVNGTSNSNTNAAVQDGSSSNNDDGPTFGPDYVPGGGFPNPPVTAPIEQPIVSGVDQPADKDKDGTSKGTTASPTASPVMATSLFATTPPKVKGVVTTVPVASPVQTFAPVLSGKGLVPAVLAAAPTFAPALVSAEEVPGAVPASSPTNTTIYITAGFLPDYMMAQAGALLPQLPGTVDDTFLVHLGDWNDISTDPSCAQTNFQTIADFYSASSVPVYWTVGDNEYNDCPDPMGALQLWKNTFVGYETRHWQPPPWKVYRQGEVSILYASFTENFSFAQGQVAYVMLNIVGSKTHDEAEFALRHKANLDWVDFAYNVFKDSAKTFVIFAHAAPDNENRSNKSFYDELFTAMGKKYLDKTFVLVNRGTGKWGIKENYEGIANLHWVSIPGPLFPPIKLAISEGKPMIVEQVWPAV